VYVKGPPDDDITTSIQDSFVAVATPPTIRDRESLDAYRKEVVEFLKTKTFASFPSHPTPLNIKLEFHTRDFSKAGREDYSFVPEPGWRLKFSLHRDEPKEVTSPILLVLVNPEEGRWDRYSLTAGLPNGVNVAYFEARGIGETGWSPSRQWHIRRAAAWTGRTIASMRVYDVLRCLEAIRSVPGVDPNDVRIVAQGEMAAVAAYAALLDGRVRSLILKNPPPTQNAPSSRDGGGMALEMLNCLQVTDLPQVAGLFFPGNFIALGEQPDSFKWVEELYKTLGSPGSYKHIQKMSELKIKK
jgi:pimeloyl-ACP methyl ester carboxylesterase